MTVKKQQTRWFWYQHLQSLPPKFKVWTSNYHHYKVTKITIAPMIWAHKTHVWYNCSRIKHRTITLFELTAFHSYAYFHESWTMMIRFRILTFLLRWSKIQAQQLIKRFRMFLDKLVVSDNLSQNGFAKTIILEIVNILKETAVHSRNVDRGWI